jgi:fructose-specific phosphotransferase system IIC component
MFRVKSTYLVTVNIDDSRGGMVSHSWNVTVKPAPKGIVVDVNNSSILPLVIIIVIAVIVTTLLLSKLRRKPDKDIQSRGKRMQEKE